MCLLVLVFTCSTVYWQYCLEFLRAVRNKFIACGRQTNRATTKMGDTFWSTGRQIGTEVETTGPQLWKCKRLTIAVLEQLCAVLGQRQFNITHQTNLPHSSLECYEVAGLIDTSQCSVNQSAQMVSQPISDFLPTISRYFNNDPLPKTVNNRLLW